MRAFLVPVLSVIALVASAAPAPAFETTPDEQFPAAQLQTRLADPDDLAVQGMAQRFTGQSATISHFGNTTIGIIGPGSGYADTPGPFLSDPAAGTVPSKRER